MVFIFSAKNRCPEKKGFHPLCTAAMRMLAYACPADSLKPWTLVQKFVQGVNEVFGPQYLRRPTAQDIQAQLKMVEAHGFPGMIGSLDCMHWEWKNCPVGWQGQFTRGDHGKATVMLEAVATHDLWIWHAFFGVAGSNNDINVLNQSPLFTDVLQGRAPLVHFSVNERQYDMGYYLVDGIYPGWAAFVKSIPSPQSDRHKLFARKQESARKDVERAFAALQSRFAILRYAARYWHRSTLSDIMYACIILHNMIVEDERDSYARAGNYDLNYDQERYHPIPEADNQQGPIDGFNNLLLRNKKNPG
ncbi:hypothetical protein U9M48_041107 [Paspalum notatum var. saurae]|uniref:Transposase n=1 Tax=Paspalum notatum var. saurae TaxID=547442 RepID=A0AAQ3UN79_PASNO